eukprot:jgi/Psemu1/29564/gm1.29564_g
MNAATYSATWHFYKPEPAVPLVGQLHDAYFRFYKEDEDQRERDEVFKVDVFNSSFLESSTGSNISRKDPSSHLAFAIRRKRDREKTHTMKATKKLFKPLSKYVVDRSNKLNKGHLCMKWFNWYPSN